MDLERVDFFKVQYERYTVDEIEDLVARIAAHPDAFTSEAKNACDQVLSNRNFSADTLLKSRKKHEQEDRQRAREVQSRAEARSQKLTRRVGKLVGFFGIPGSLLIAGLSISQEHFGGLVASILFFGCAVWLAFYYQGD